ncbi:hypothetical protein ACFQZ4_30030 [Catellatospora coxensis]|uniref:Uncharacterized protein n=1 Tax=Catellatospora coxensis TaxID=310354 RepID=A0A8J3PAZ9_9ACTN|nr:hypothetical protein [Catellatospora coxensis]GIG10816.1 hypothetical protein Cco03nite_75160 [Catellatospora coxensis]
MSDLLALLDEEADAFPHELAAGRFHLNEELPAWLAPLLLDAHDIAASLPGELVELLRRVLTVEQAAAAAFNFRSRDGVNYKERSQAVKADFSEQTRSRVLDLTTDLGLVTPQPTRFSSYAKTIVLGGGYRSPLLRSRYTAQVQSTGIDLGELSFLGSPRPLIEEPPEQVVTQAYAPEAVDEFDLMLAAARSEFGLEAAKTLFLCGCASSEHPCPAWKARDAAGAAGTPAAFTHERQTHLIDDGGEAVGSVFSASTGRPPYRPDTSDTFALWARYTQPRLGQRVLVVTTQMFVPFQLFEGLRWLYLPFSLDLDVVGLGVEWGDRPQTAESLLQEVLSAIRSARRLLVDCAEVLVKRGPDTSE